MYVSKLVLLTVDCMPYIAYCTSLMYRQNPCLVVYSQHEMRIYLRMCLEQKKLTQFPALKTRQLIKEDVLTVQIELCPVCMFPDDGELMVYCKMCEKWYHKNCVAEFDETDKNNNWFCANCNLKSQTLVHLFVLFMFIPPQIP